MDLHSQQPTANSQQPTANSQQPTANSQQPTSFSGLRRSLQMLPLTVGIMMMALPGYAFATHSLSQADSYGTEVHPDNQHVTVIDGGGQTAQPHITPIMPPTGDIPLPPTGNSPSHPITLQTFDQNTEQHQATIIFSNGFRAVLDANRRTITMGYAGQRKTISWGKVLRKWAHGNVQLAKAREQELLKMLYSKADNSRLAALDNNASNTLRSSESRGGWVPNSRYRYKMASIAPLPSIGIEEPPTSPLPPIDVTATPLPPFSCWQMFTCHYVTLPHQPWQTDHFVYGYWYLDSIIPPSPDGKIFHPQDYHAWNKWRQLHCDNAKSAKISIALGVVSFGATWKTALAAAEAGPLEWGVGALAMAAEGVEIGYYAMELNSNNKICLSEYPGYLQW